MAKKLRAHSVQMVEYTNAMSFLSGTCMHPILGSTTTTIGSAESTQLKVIAARLEYAISLLEKITNTTAAGS